MSRDITLEDTTYIQFTTKAFATGIPTVLAGTPVVSAYENDSTTQITDGITLGVDHDSVVGLNLLTIVATDANGYEDGKDYSLVITAGTVDGVSVVGEVVGEFTVGRIADGVWDEVLAGNTHNVQNSAGKRLRQLGGLILHDGTLQAGSTSTSAVLDAGASTVDDFYNHTKILIGGGTGSEQEAIISDYVGSTRVATITPAWRTTPDATSEFEIVPAVAHAATVAGGYEGGSVWIDTVDGVSGTQLYVNGTVDNPVDNIADARTIADALNMHIFTSLPGSSFTLAQTFNNFQFTGVGYTLNFGSQDVGGSRFIGGAILGIGSGSTRIVLRDCIFVGATTLPLAALIGCNLTAQTITLANTGIYHTFQCFAHLAVIDFGAAIGNTTFHFHAFSGNVQLESVGDTGTDDIEMQGTGRFTEGTCTGGNVTISGNISVSGITNLTLVEGARVDVDNILTTQMTESYAANGVAPTLAQAIFAIHQILMDHSISGVTWTVEKLDGTTAFVLTLDDATTPTGVNRA